jgi:hypothetical protein
MKVTGQDIEMAGSTQDACIPSKLVHIEERVFAESLIERKIQILAV